MTKNSINTTPRKTFMEIMKVHNKEVPMVNMLAYLFRPNEKHQLGTICLTALLDTIAYDICADSTTKDTILREQPVFPDSLQSRELIMNNVEVFTEVPTNGQDDEAKRIDILINADNFVVCIEFKIDHDWDNPLATYQSYVSQKYKDKHQFYIVLAPYRKQAIDAASKYFETKNDFKLIILSHFIEQVKLQLPEDYGEDNHSNPYAQYFFDFVQTIENRKIRTQIIKRLEEVKSELKRGRIQSDIVRKWNGGYLLIHKKAYNLKLRVIEENYQIEKWISKSQKDKVQTDVEVSDIVRIASLKMF